MSRIKDIEWKLISELIKNSRKSDRELAKAIGSSQPTVSRLRSKLEKNVVLEYTMWPSLVKLGFEVLAVTFTKQNYEKQLDPKSLERVEDFVKTHPNIIFATKGEGIHSDRMSISLHRDYSDYSHYIQELRAEHGENYTVTETFLVSLVGGNITRSLSLRHIADHLKEAKKSS